MQKKKEAERIDNENKRLMFGILNQYLNIF